MSSPRAWSAVAFMLMGAALMAVVAAGLFGAYLFLGKPSAVPTPPAVVSVAVDETAVEAVEETVAAVTSPAPPPGSAAAAEPAPVAPPAVIDTPPPSDEGAHVELPPPEDEAAKALREADAEARERAYLEKKFDERKAQFMGIIDTYFTLPLDQREDYLKKAFEEMRVLDEADRLAEGLPSRPQQRGRMMGGPMMDLMRNRLTEDEKKKVSNFMGDVIQSQVAKFQSAFEEGMRTPPPPPGPQQ